jgi:hypothetical protein
MEYQYNVRQLEAQVTTADVRKGVAGKKVCAQLELVLQEMARDGWELQGQYQFEVEVKAGCFDFLLRRVGQSTSDGNYRIYQLVFRKPM